MQYLPKRSAVWKNDAYLSRTRLFKYNTFYLENQHNSCVDADGMRRFELSASERIAVAAQQAATCCPPFRPFTGWLKSPAATGRQPLLGFKRPKLHLFKIKNDPPALLEDHFLVWVRRFELPASWTPFKHATKLRYTQKKYGRSYERGYISIGAEKSQVFFCRSILSAHAAKNAKNFRYQPFITFTFKDLLRFFHYDKMFSRYFYYWLN